MCATRICSIHVLITVQENNLSDEQLDAVIHSYGAANGFWSYVGWCLLKYVIAAQKVHVYLSPCRTPEGRKGSLLSHSTLARVPWKGRKVEFSGG